jgi:ATP-dependent DNA ligase
LSLDHVENDGKQLFDQIVKMVKMDLEGMVCKRKSSPCPVTEKPSPYWIKVKNSRYSQAQGRYLSVNALPLYSVAWKR